MNQMFFIAALAVLFGSAPALCVLLVYFLFSSFCLTLELAEVKTELLNGF